MKDQILQNTNRIDIADVLRGFAVAAIGILHCIEHFNFYSFPATDLKWLEFANKATWDSLFFAFGGKAYAIFALLFGFSYYIQESNAFKRGQTFRMRFMWRVFLLLLIAQINAAFFTGEVLVLYAVVAFVLPLFSRFSNKTMLFIAIFLMLQPMEWGRMIYALSNPDYVAPPSLDSPFWKACRTAQSSGTFLQMTMTNLWNGQLASLGWAVENARFFQTPALFLLGYLIGRKKLFETTEENNKFWIIVLISSIICFFPLNGLQSMLKDFITNKAALKPATLIVSSLAKFAFMMFLTSFMVVLHSNFSRCRDLFNKMIPYGRMSLTNYITQSMIGGFIFYNWGLKVDSGAFYSTLIGIALVGIQFFFCKWWLTYFKQGPLEWIWKKGTWIGTSKAK